MLKVILLTLIVFGSGNLFGFFIPSEEFIERQRILCEQVPKEFPGKRIERFLRKVIDENPIVDGVDLRKSKYDENWICVGWKLFSESITFESGDWQFGTSVEGNGRSKRVLVKRNKRRSYRIITEFEYSNKFTLLYKCAHGFGKWIEGIVDENGLMKLKSIKREEVYELSA